MKTKPTKFRWKAARQHRPTWMLLLALCAVPLYATTTNYVAVVGNVMQGQDLEFSIINPTNLDCATDGLVTNGSPGIWVKHFDPWGGNSGIGIWVTVLVTNSNFTFVSSFNTNCCTTPLIPIQSGDNDFSTPPWTLASSVSGSDPAYAAWHAFSQETNAQWVADSASFPQWVQYYSTNIMIACAWGFTYSVYPNPSGCDSIITVSGSNSGSGLVVLDTFNGHISSSNWPAPAAAISQSFYNTNAFQYYRFTWTTNSGCSPSFRQVQLYGR
jgi:hypothetical protein